MLIKAFQDFLKGQQSSDNSLSVVLSSDSESVDARVIESPTSSYSGIVNTSDTTVITAPSAGQHLAFSLITVQSATATASNVQIKDAVSNPTKTFHIRCPVDGSGISQFFARLLHWPSSKPAIVGLSQAEDHFIFIQYYVIDDQTGLPI